VFSDGGARVAYMDALNIGLYGSTVTQGSGKAIVLRTGTDGNYLLTPL
jgi:magnesium-transporting ATPase (P-type)